MAMASVFVVLAAQSCKDNTTAISYEAEEPQAVFTAGFDNNATRTIRQSDGKVFWNAYETIGISTGTGVFSKFTSSNSTSAPTAKFSGPRPTRMGDMRFYAVYPFDGSAMSVTTSGNPLKASTVTVNVTIPFKSVQNAVEGTFADDTFPMIAISEDSTLFFRHICGGAKFKVSQSGITSIEFRGNQGEQIAGNVQVKAVSHLNTGVATYDPETVSLSRANASKVITVNAPQGGFAPEKYYYITIYPTVFEKGFTIKYVFNEGLSYSEYSTSARIAVERAMFGTIENKDAGRPRCSDFTELTAYGVYESIDGDSPVPVLLYGSAPDNQMSVGQGPDYRFFRIYNLDTEEDMELRFSTGEAPVHGSEYPVSLTVNGNRTEMTVRVLKVDGKTVWLEGPDNTGCIIAI